MFIIYASEQLNYMAPGSPTKLPKNTFRRSTHNTMVGTHMWRCCVHYLSVIGDLMTCYVQTKARKFMANGISNAEVSTTRTVHAQKI